MKPFYEKVRGDLYKLAGYGVNGTFTAYRGAPSFITRRGKKAHQRAAPTLPQVTSFAAGVPLATGETAVAVAPPVIACLRCGSATTRCSCPPPHASALDRAVERRRAQTQREALAQAAAGQHAFPGVVGQGGRP